MTDIVLLATQICGFEHLCSICWFWWTRWWVYNDLDILGDFYFTDSVALRKPSLSLTLCLYISAVDEFMGAFHYTDMSYTDKDVRET